MKRATTVQFLEKAPDHMWDVLVIGGGATGLGVALDAASRGFQTLLLEQSDFTKATSSRSTKLVHGGVRYLAQGNIKLVLEALHERGLLIKNAPHLSSNQVFVVPSYGWWDSVFYGIGLKIYDLLSGKWSIGKSEIVSAQKVKAHLPTIQGKGLVGGITYYDGQFDDARMGINLAQSVVDHGGHVLNYVQVSSLMKDQNGKVNGVLAIDGETGTQYALKAKAVVNATGVFVDQVLAMDDKSKPALVRPSQGTHLVLDRSFLPGAHALMIPNTSDGRVLFAIPWHGKLLVGTTDTALDETALEPRPLAEEVDFILANFGLYVQKRPTRKDVLSVFSGLRPLARPQAGSNSTKEISRSHKILISESALITIIGGKWTTYRKMAEDALQYVIQVADLPPTACHTAHLRLHGAGDFKEVSSLGIYGTDAHSIRSLMKANPALSELLHHRYPYTKAEVVWAVQNEMARTVEDVLARRIRMLFLDAEAAIEMAPVVAELMADQLQTGEEWRIAQIRSFEDLAKGYLLA